MGDYNREALTVLLVIELNLQVWSGKTALLSLEGGVKTS